MHWLSDPKEWHADSLGLESHMIVPLCAIRCGILPQPRLALPGVCYYVSSLLFLAGTRRYILPSLSLVPNDAEESVRVEFTAVVAQLAATAYRFLQQLQCLHAREMQPSSASTAPALVSPSYQLI